MSLLRGLGAKFLKPLLARAHTGTSVRRASVIADTMTPYWSERRQLIKEIWERVRERAREDTDTGRHGLFTANNVGFVAQ